MMDDAAAVGEQRWLVLMELLVLLIRSGFGTDRPSAVNFYLFEEQASISIRCSPSI